MWLFAATGFVESLAFGHLGAFLPILLDELAVPRAAAPRWIGILSALAFVIGLPLLPFWGVWADRYGRKLIIIRSSVAGALMFALAGLSHDVWMLAGARLLGGFVLGNTGVMMAVQEAITPPQRLGRAVSLISAGSPVGMAIGPFLGGAIVAAYSVRALLLIDAGLTALMALALGVLLKEEVKPHHASVSTWAGIARSFRAIVHNRAVRTLYVVTFVGALGVSAAQPYTPVLLQQMVSGPRLAHVIGFVFTVSGIAMALLTPAVGWAGDRAGHLRVWRGCLLAAGIGLAGQAWASSAPQLAVWRSLQAAAVGGAGALGMVLLARYADPETRTPVLTLSLLPNQLSWFLGPLTGAVIATSGVTLPFAFGATACIMAVGASYLLRDVEAARPPAAGV